MMNLSDLIKQLEKAIAKYGDIPIGCYGKVYAHDVEKASDATKICALRVIQENQASLPGISLAEEDTQPDNASYFAVLFYED